MLPTPTEEQLAVIDAARTTTDNLSVSALAGTAKSTTLEMVAVALPGTQILSLAFNKATADKLNKSLPSNCNSSTINSICHRGWSDTIGKRLQIKMNKNFTILIAESEGLPTAKRDWLWRGQNFTDTLDMIAQAKRYGYFPPTSGGTPLLTREEFYNEVCDPEPTELQILLVENVLRRSIKASFAGELDFDDQVLMATCFSCLLPLSPLVLIDEQQDLSELNHTLMKKLCRKRVIGVGDEFQSIYAFRGAHPDSMSQMESAFNMQILPLTTTFRCPQTVVREARWRAPMLQWAPWAIEGNVRTLHEWNISAIPEDATVLCRNNVPLFTMAVKFLKSGRNCTVIGGDIGKGIVKIMKKLGPELMRQADTLAAIDAWEVDRIAKSRAKNLTADKAECMRLFARQGANLLEAITYAEFVLNQKGRVTFSTVHKAKGAEWDDVFLLDKFLINTEEVQEANLLYVAQTRAKRSLTYITSEGLQ